MIDFEHVEICGKVRIAPSESIETRAEEQILAHATIDRNGQFVFGKAAAGSHEGAQTACGRMRFMRGGDGKFLSRFRRKNEEGKRIAEDRRIVNELMGGTPHGYAQCCPAGAMLIHLRQGTLWPLWGLSASGGVTRIDGSRQTTGKRSRISTCRIGFGEADCVESKKGWRKKSAAIWKWQREISQLKI